MRTTSAAVFATRSAAFAALALLVFAWTRRTTVAAGAGRADRKVDEALLRKDTQALLDGIAVGDITGFVDRREARDIAWTRARAAGK